eukprot:1351039-Pleurochrysis_carterae.AAC.1
MLLLKAQTQVYRLGWLMLQKDKWEHFVACFIISLAAYAALFAVPRRLRSPGMHICVALGIGSMAGVAKEAGDAFDVWPLCPPCDPSTDDMIADLLGVSFAALFIAFSICLSKVLYALQLVAQGYYAVSKASSQISETSSTETV